MNRARPFVDKIKSEQQLDAVTEDAAGGLWDVDITDDLILLYIQKYQVSADA